MVLVRIIGVVMVSARAGTAMEQAKAVQRDQMSGQLSLFSLARKDNKPAESPSLPMPDLPERCDMLLSKKQR